MIMAMLVSEIREWLDSLKDDDQVFIDDGGLALMVVGITEPYLEVGGYSEDDEDSILEERKEQ